MSESEAKEEVLSYEAENQQTLDQVPDSQTAAEDEDKQMKSEDEGGVRKLETQSDQHKMTGQSRVYTATKETLFPTERTHPKTHALSIEWVFGMTPTLPVFTLQDHSQLVLLYVANNVGIIYNPALKSQHVLQGHSHSISCMCVSEDRRWVATGDNSSKGIGIIWDSYSGIPVHTIFDCHPTGGVAALAFSSDTKHLVTLGGKDTQRVCIWDWTSKAQKPLFCTDLDPKHSYQDYVAFNPNDRSQVLSSSDRHVLFYRTAKGRLEYFAHMFKKSSPDPSKSACIGDASLSRSAFHCTKPQILTASGCSIVVWDVSHVDNQRPWTKKARTIALQDDPITVLIVADGCVITGDVRGHIYFYDENYLLLRQFTNLNLDPIVFLSFSKESTEGFVEDCTIEAHPFVFRNFLMTTSGFKVVHVDAQRVTSQTLLHEDCEPVHAVACHPCKPAVVTGNQQGILKVWDYNKKVLTDIKVFKTEGHIQCVSFDPKGLYLAVGFGNGAVHILNSHTLQSNPEDCFRCTTDSIHLITFSSDSQYLATADAGKGVTVFRLQKGSVPLWTCLGRHGSHYKPIKDLLFGVHLDSTQPRLLSLGLDRKLVEYDLENSDVNKLLILSSERVEQSAEPLCMTWYPPLTSEQFLLIGTDQYKLKLFNSTTKMCRKTLLGPTYGSPIKRIAVLPKYEEPEMSSYYLTFITEDKLGLQMLPLDGNPHKSKALNCHSAGVSAFACSPDGRFIFTVGGSDCCALSWEINLKVLDGAAALGGEGMAPFYDLLDGGRDGRFYKEMEDFFYYCQIHHQINQPTKKQVSDKIPLSEVPFVMRALGFFPTEQEIEDIQNEVKFSKYTETGKYVTELDLDEFIKLYVNHRPAFDISSNELVQAFQVLCKSDGAGQPVLKRNELIELLQVRGEHMIEEEVAKCFITLSGLNTEEEEEEALGADSQYSWMSAIPDEISVEMLTDQILGLQFSVEQSANSSPPES